MQPLYQIEISDSFFFLKSQQLPRGLRHCNSAQGNLVHTFHFIKLLILLFVAGVHFSLSFPFIAAAYNFGSSGPEASVEL